MELCTKVFHLVLSIIVHAANANVVSLRSTETASCPDSTTSCISSKEARRSSLVAGISIELPSKSNAIEMDSKNLNRAHSGKSSSDTNSNH